VKQFRLSDNFVVWAVVEFRAMGTAAWLMSWIMALAGIERSGGASRLRCPSGFSPICWEMNGCRIGAS
jgi:hypothetical protein